MSLAFGAFCWQHGVPSRDPLRGSAPGRGPGADGGPAGGCSEVRPGARPPQSNPAAAAANARRARGGPGPCRQTHGARNGLPVVPAPLGGPIRQCYAVHVLGEAETPEPSTRRPPCRPAARHRATIRKPSCSSSCSGTDPAGRRDASRWPDDEERPLTPRAEARTLAAARGLRRTGAARRPRRDEPAGTRRADRAPDRGRDPARAPRSARSTRPGGSYRNVVEWLGASAPTRPWCWAARARPGPLAACCCFGAPRAPALREAGRLPALSSSAIRPRRGGR